MRPSLRVRLLGFSAALFLVNLIKSFYRSAIHTVDTLILSAILRQYCSLQQRDSQRPFALQPAKAACIHSKTAAQLQNPMMALVSINQVNSTYIDTDSGTENQSS